MMQMLICLKNYKMNIQKKLYNNHFKYWNKNIIKIKKLLVFN